MSNTPTIHELGSSRTKTGTYPTVVYSDVIVTTVPTAPPSSMSIPSSDPIDVVDPTVTLLTGPTGTTYTYGTHDLGHHPDYEPGHVTDSDDEMETMTANINPTNFRGTVSENADTWLRYLITYCAYKGYDDERSKALFKVLLAESAAVWFDSLQQATQNDWQLLKAAFLARYTTPEFLKYKHANELFNSKQGDRSVDDFCAYMQNLAREVEADEHMLCYVVLNGLNSEIKNHVTRSQPNGWKELVDAAKVGEMCVPEIGYCRTELSYSST